MTRPLTFPGAGATTTWPCVACCRVRTANPDRTCDACRRAVAEFLGEDKAA